MDRKDFLKARIMEGMAKKSGTKPMSDKEKSLAALAHPKDKITHKDVLVGRGVLKKEEVEQIDELSDTTLTNYAQKVHDDSLKHDKDPSKRSAVKRNKSVMGFSRALNKLESRPVKEEVEQIDEMDKSQPSSSRGAEGLPLGKKAEPIKTDKAKQDALKALQKQYKKVKEEVEQVDEGNKENKAKKNTYVANIIKKKLSSQVLPSLKFGRRELKKEEVEQIDELKKGTLMSYVGKAREKNIKDSAKNRLAGTETSLADIDKQQAKVSKRSKGIQRAYTRLNKEEVEQMGEAIRVTTLNSRSYGHPEDTPKGSPQRKRLASQFKKIKNDTKNKSTFGVQARKYMKPGDSVHYGDVGIAKEEVEQVNELKKSTMASYVKKAAASYGRDKQLIGRESPDGTVKNARPEMKKAVKNRLAGINRAAERLAKEEVEQIDEASWTSATSMHGATRKQNRTNPPTHNIRKGDVVKTSDGKKGAVSFIDGDDIHVTGTNIYYPKKTEKHSASTLKKEEVDLDEAFINGREYASHGLMHPDHAKWQSHRVGVHTDFYAHGTGDKINGQVMKNDGKEVHIKATKSSGGKLHKFKVQSELPKGKKKQKDDLDDTYNQQGTDDKGRNRKDREDDDDGTYHQRGTHDKGNKKQGVAEADKHYSK